MNGFRLQTKDFGRQGLGLRALDFKPVVDLKIDGQGFWASN